MDVKLPNGQVISNVPDGTTKEDLVAKLKNNGYDTSWYTPPERSYPERVVKEGLPAVSNLGVDILHSIPSGLRGLGAVVGEAVASPFTGKGPGEWLESGAESFESNMDYLTKQGNFGLPRFDVPEADQAMQDALNKGIGYIGDIAEEPNPFQMGESFADSPAARTLGEAGANFLPVPGAGLLGRGLRKTFPKLDPQTAINAKLKELQKLQEAIDRSRNERLQTAPVDDLFPTELHPAERSPFRVPEEERAQIERELADPTQIRYPDEMAIDPNSPQGSLLGGLGGQPDAFALQGGSTPRTGPEVDIQGLRGPASDPFRHFQPKLTPDEYTGPRARIGDPSAPNLQPGVPARISPEERKFRFEGPAKGQAALERRRQALRTHDEGIPFEEGLGEAAQAAAVPGFLRSAEEVMRARRWEDAPVKREGEGVIENAPDLPVGDRAPMNVGKRGRQVGAIKMPGGMWTKQTEDSLSKSLWPDRGPWAIRDDRLSAAGRAMAEGDRLHARTSKRMAQWADKVVARYLKKYAGTDRDPLKDIHIPYGDGTARWEDITDSAFEGRAAADRTNEQGRYYADDPKIKPDEQIYGLRDSASEFITTPLDDIGALQALHSYLGHVKDYIQQRNLTPEQLERYDFVRAVRETAEWDKQMERKMQRSRAAAQKDLTVYKEYPDGFKWVKLDKPGQFAAESDVMGHSVRGYEPPKEYRFTREDNPGLNMDIHEPTHPDWVEAAGDFGHPGYGLGGWDAIKRGDAEIYSLRDSKNNSHVTIEVKNWDENTQRAIDGQFDKPSNIDWKPQITQIKGKQNRAPEKRYLPYVQDFVRSREWGDVGDLGNTGLMSKLTVFNKIEDIINDKKWTSEARGLHKDMAKRVLSEKNKKWFSREEVDDLLKELGLSNTVDGGPGTSQRGGPGLSKPRSESSEFERFKREARAQGILLPDDVVRAVYEGKQPDLPETKSGHPDEHIKKVLNNNPGLKALKNEFNDDRPLPELKKALEGPNAPKDIDWADKNVVGKIINGSFVASQHPLISRTSSEINRVKDWELMTGNKYMHGKSAKSPDEGTANYMWKQLNPSEKEAVRAVGWEINNVPEKLTPDQIQRYSMDVNGRPLNPAEMRALTDRIEIMKKVLEEEVNPMRVAEGKKPIKALPNFFSPAVFDKPFKIIFYDKSGNPVHIESTYLRPNMEKIWKNFEGEYSKDQIKLAESKIRASADLETFDLILRQLDEQSRSQASRAIAEGLRRLGFARHGMQRKGATGGKGSGRKQVREYEQTYEEYIREMVRYVGNRKLDKFFNELNDLDVPGHPKAKAYSLEAIDAARGKINETAEKFDKFATELINGAIEYGTFGKVGLPQTFWSQFLKLGAAVKVPLLIGFFHPIHIAAQILQHSYMLPAGMRMAADGGFLKQQHAAWTALFKTYTDMIQEVSGGGKRQPLVQALNERGALDATVKFDWVNYASENINDYHSLLQDHLTGVSLLTAIEKHGVRKPAAYYTLNLMEAMGADLSKGLTPDVAAQVKNIISKYMVDNRFYNKSHVFTRTGLTGTALSPLMNFMTTWLGMFREYHRLAKSGYYVTPSASAPFVTFMALNLALAGALNLVGAREYNQLATLSNEWFGTKLPLWEEVVWSDKYMGIKDRKLTSGVLTDATGLNVGATFNAPTITGNYAAGATFWGELGLALYTMGKTAAGKGTMTEFRESLKPMLPRFNVLETIPGTDLPLSWSGAEKLTTPEGIPYQSANAETAVYKRDEEDWAARRLGTYSSKEAEYKTKTNVLRQSAAFRTKRFSSAMNKVGDRLLIQGKRDISDLVLPLAKEDGYTYQDIYNGVVAELRSRLVEPQAQMQGRGTSSRQAYIYKLLKDLEAR